MKKYMDLEDMSKVNCSSVLNVIREAKEVSRKEISDITGLSWGGMTKIVNKLFEKGYIEEGMTNDMVNLLWGPPDRESDDGFVWEYYTREGKLITRLLWKNPEQARLKGYENELVLDKIEGDRYGGSPPPTSKTSSNY